MKKILLAGSFALSDEQLARLKAVGEVNELGDVQSSAEWLEKVKGYDVICTWGDYVLDNLDKLENVLVTYPYTELGSFDSEALTKKNVFVANAKGSNKKSIAEWTLFSILSLFRKFPTFLRATEQHQFVATESLENKNVVVIGHGTIGTEVGERCAAFGMNVRYFERGDDLSSTVKDADVVINALNSNSSTKNLLNQEFFMNMKQGSYYVTFARPWTYDIDGLIAAIDTGVVAGAGIDCDPESFGDVDNNFYKKCMSNDAILVTPHIAYATNQARVNSLEIMVQNVEKYIAGEPQNVIKK